MANKEKASTQSTLFDVPAVQTVVERCSSKEKRIREEVDISCLGLNSLFLGKSLVYKDFQDYIKRSNLIK